MRTLNRRQPRLANPSLSLAICASALIAAACSAPPGSEVDDEDGLAEFGGTVPSGATAPGTPAAQTPAAAAPAPGGSVPVGASPTPAAPSPSEQPASGGTPLTPTTPPASNGSNAGANGGAGGASMVPAGDFGAGGSSMVDGAGGAPPVEQQPPAQQPPAQQPPVVTPPPAAAGPDIPCPADATFCSGFEGAGLPEGSVFQPTYITQNGPAIPDQIELDTAVFHAGSQSLHLPVGANYYRMLSVPIPGNNFWVRLYTRSDVGFGAMGSTHASLFLASSFAPDGDYNGDTAVEIAEQFNQILLNKNDQLFGTAGTNPNGQPGTTLPDNTWTCMEAQFDAPGRAVHVFVNGTEIIDATGWSQLPTTYQSFRFGYLRYDSPARDVWMDDVVVAASRVGCQ